MSVGWETSIPEGFAALFVQVLLLQKTEKWKEKKKPTNQTKNPTNSHWLYMTIKSIPHSL